MEKFYPGDMMKQKLKCNLKKIILLELDDMTQVELAQSLGMSESHFSRIATGRVIPSLPIAIKIARGIGKHVDEIWEIEE